MSGTYKALKARSQLCMLSKWDSLHPRPDYYVFACRLDLHPFMGLNKCIAGRLYQMRANKSYLAAHPSWWSEDSDASCPRCRSDDEIFEHAILDCSTRLAYRSRYLEPALSLLAESPLWDNMENLRSLGQ